MVEITYSTKGKKCSARWYPRPDRISIFLNKIYQNRFPDIDLIDLNGFIAELNAFEFHELIHIYGYRNGCHPISKCQEGKCYLCRLTFALILWFEYDGSWTKGIKSYLKVGKFQNEKNILTTKCPECGCKEFSNEDELGKGFRLCIQCKQEWWTDINYKKNKI